MSDPDGSRAPDGLARLFAEVVDGLTRLVRGEVALARAEARAAVSGLARGLGLLAIAAILGLVALNLLAAAVVAGLVALGLSPHWATVVVGAVLALAAAGLLWRGLALLREVDFMPRRSLDGLRRDVETLTSGGGHDAEED